MTCYVKSVHGKHVPGRSLLTRCPDRCSMTAHGLCPVPSCVICAPHLVDSRLARRLERSQYGPSP